MSEWICEAETLLELLKGNGAVEKVLVRCKDCKHWDTDWQTIEGQHYCSMVDQQTLGDFFCADGERREE